MTIRQLLAFVLFILPLASSRAQSPDLSDILLDVAFLSSDALEGRETGSEGERLAGEYIADRFESIGLTPSGTDGEWFQPFTFKFSPNPHDTTGAWKSGRNVVGLLDNGATRTVIVGAHYDHLGWGGIGSRAPGDSLIHNGADDNASGVAAMLEVANRISESSIEQNVLFIAFSGEEHGLIGSKHFVEEPTIDLADVNYMINLDMVGRLEPDRGLVVGGAGTSPTWIPLLEEMGENRFQIKFDSSGAGPSDHTSFYLKDKPVLHFFTGQHRQYHKPSDDSHLINYDGISGIAAFVAGIIERTDGPEPLVFAETRDESRDHTARFKVTMGVMPDYAWDGEGMRIDAVLDGRPAARAGLEDGDVVVRIGDMPVGDIYGYMEALGNFEEGDETTVVVMRGDEELERPITF